MHAVDIGPIPPERRTQSPFDLFLIFAGANIVATTLVTGASLVPAFTTLEALGLIAVGSVAGAALVASLAPVGPRLGVPSVIAARAALGTRGAALLALLLYVTNFAWIALNNVIAASACARALGGAGSERAWAAGLGVAATAVVALGPRAVGIADRVAVPLMLLTGAALTARALTLESSALQGGGAAEGPGWLRGLDIVVGYQVAWILMFADYSRFTASARRGAIAVFLALATTSLWYMGLGAVAARVARSPEPGAMIAAMGLGGTGALLLALATLTTNFVNVYLSALAWKSLLPRFPEQASVWSIGLVGTALSLLPGWLDRYADFMALLGSLLVPVGGVLFAHFFLLGGETDVGALYDPAGRYAAGGGVRLPALAAWVLGAGVYFTAGSWGGTLPALATAIVAYLILARRG